MKSDFMLAINQLCTERKLSRDVVLEAVEAALISAYKRNFGSAANIEARIDPNTGEVCVFAIKEVADDVHDRKMQISVESARALNPDAQVGDTVMVESTPRDFGRIAAQTAKQVILQRIREAERDALYSTFVDKAGEIAVGTVQSVEYHTGDVIVNVDGAEALLPAREQVPGERHRRGARLRAYVVDVRRGNRGPQITLSRRSPSLLGRLLELEVPEIFNGTVEIKGIAREAGSRSKVAVHATQEGVDPVGSCVGVRGGRIQSVVTELGGEKIDVVQWDSDVGAFIANALSPAKVMNVLLDDSPEAGKTATVIVPDRQLSLAIGKEGQNARLAAKLTGWRIDIKSATETAEETLGRFQEPVIAPEDMDILTLAETILRQRATEEFSEMERVLIRAEIRSSGDNLSWPEEPPSAEVDSSQELTVDLEAQGAELLAPEGDGPDLEDVELMEALADQDVELVSPEGVADGGGVVQPDAGDESETIPPFDGELVEDSTGWVATEPPQEYQYTWEDAPSEDSDVVWEPRWDEALLEEEEEPEPLKTSKKKRKKGRQYSKSDDMDRWS